MQKSLLLILCFLFATLVNAQQDINTSFANQMTTMFLPLNKTNLRHSILLDYGMEFTNVPAYNGTITNSTFTNSTSLKQIYNT